MHAKSRTAPSLVGSVIVPSDLLSDNFCVLKRQWVNKSGLSALCLRRISSQGNPSCRKKGNQTINKSIHPSALKATQQPDTCQEARSYFHFQQQKKYSISEPLGSPICLSAPLFMSSIDNLYPMKKAIRLLNKKAELGDRFRNLILYRRREIMT